MRNLIALATFCWIVSAAEPPTLRLGNEIRPVKYAADLTLIPGAATFNGKIDIDVVLAKPASVVWLNATELVITKAAITRGGKIQPAMAEPSGDDFIGLRFLAEMSAGPAALHIQYQGKISSKDSVGIFQGSDGNETYLYTQFESTDARRAFPCFDQPNFKTPWQLTLHIPKIDRAFSNTPQLSETAEPNDRKRVVFAQTKPLPSYLVATAVGPFDVIDAGHAGRNRVPVRIIVPKGKANRAKYAAEVTATIVERLEVYFAVPFPYEKIDNIAITAAGNFSMENAGMVTYDRNTILSDPSSDTLTRQRLYADVATHELAHEWLGDLVTTAWWDDTWLNEALATWASSKTLAAWKPQWQSRLSDLDANYGPSMGKFGAMLKDSLSTARQIRQAITSKDDISNAFDGITYMKGSAVIRMFESWMGESQFQKGVTSYLTRYSHKTADANNFLNAIASAGRPEFTRAFSTFLEQPGFPEISVDLNCDHAPTVKLSQIRYLPIGSSGGQNQLWQTPVCLRYDTASGSQSECFLLDSASAEFRLSKASACPSYLVANENASGYYVAAYRGDLLPKLLEHSKALNPAEQMTLLHDLMALLSAGHGSIGPALEAAKAFTEAQQRGVLEQARALVAYARELVPTELLPNYERYVRKLFGPHAAELGWSPKPGDDDETRLLRKTLVPFVARDGGDPALQSQARRMAEHWLASREGVDTDLLPTVLTTAAWSGGQDLFDRLLHALKSTEDPQQRALVLAGLYSFRDPQIKRQSFALLLDPDLDIRETFTPPPAPADPDSERIAFEFVKANYDALEKRLPSMAGLDYRAFLPNLGAALCDEASRKEFVALFGGRVANYVGGSRNYANVLESIRLCEARRAAQSADAVQFFSMQ
jgi:alanyl aminopeptidase